MAQKDFLFVNLSEQIGGARPFDGMASGKFIDMWGRETEFKPEEMPTYAANTSAALESTRDSNGEVVGFPIDAMNHDNQEAAGWIVGVDLDMTGGKLQFTPRWNDLGRELISSDKMRFFSPTVDLRSKTVIGGSLTNWPATRTESNHILLKPVELSAGMFTNPEQPPVWLADLKSWITGMFAGSKPEQVEETQPAPVSEGVPIMTDPIVVEMSAEQAAQLEALVDERANLRFQQMVDREKRKSRILEYSRAVTGQGLPVQGEELVDFLSDLTPEQLDKAEALFSKIADTGAIDFAERGHGKPVGTGMPLPKEMVAPLKAWIGAGQSVKDFFAVNAVELGIMSDYDLKEFGEKEQE